MKNAIEFCICVYSIVKHEICPRLFSLWSPFIDELSMVRANKKFFMILCESNIVVDYGSTFSRACFLKFISSPWGWTQIVIDSIVTKKWKISLNFEEQYQYFTFPGRIYCQNCQHLPHEAILKWFLQWSEKIMWYTIGSINVLSIIIGGSGGGNPSPQPLKF